LMRFLGHLVKNNLVNKKQPRPAEKEKPAEDAHTFPVVKRNIKKMCGNCSGES